MNNKNTRTRFGLSIAAVLTAMILVTGAIFPAINQAYAATAYDGRAIAASISSPLGATTFMDSGQLSATDGEVVAAEPISIQSPLATADGLISAAMASSGAQSQSAVGELVLLPNDLNTITAYFAMAETQATCSSVSGYSDITDLTIGGQVIQVTGEPNQVVSVPGGLTLTINEQIVDGNSITVNALHLTTPLGTDVIVGSASSSASCSDTSSLPSLFGLSLIPEAFALGGVPSAPGCVDFVTGGGWIVPPPNKGTFGLVAGFKNGGDNPRGNLQYNDHTNNIKVHAEDVLYYHCGQFDNSRVFGGHARVNQESGWCYQVFVQDNGEPGRNDFFSIFLWAPPTPCPSTGNPPTPSNYAAGNNLGGGNIQLHTK